jgi:hypothetical protein
MTPQQKIKSLILQKNADLNDFYRPEITAENVDDLYDELEDNRGALNEIRCDGIETGIPGQYSRHYESDEVAMQCQDGSWVGWTYWYGGGKHGEPEAMDWVEHAYDVECKEEEKLVVVQTFTKVTT